MDLVHFRHVVNLSEIRHICVLIGMNTATLLAVIIHWNINTDNIECMDCCSINAYVCELLVMMKAVDCS